MRLAVIDPDDKVILSWPTVKDAHADLADLFAAYTYPGRLKARKRRKIAKTYRAHLLALQQQTVRL